MCLTRVVSLCAAVVIGGATHAAALDHFTCYRSRTATGTPKYVPHPGVAFVDRFAASNVILFAHERLCAPTDKNSEDPTAPAHVDHLAGYQIRKPEPHFDRVHGLTITNQLGTITVDATKPVRALVPTAKSLTSIPPEPPSPGVDHFRCYKIRASAGSTPFAPISGVAVEDQFGTLTVDVKKPNALCVPADKNGGSPGAENHPDVLLCYAVKTTPGTPKFATVSPVFAANQLHEATLTLRKLAEICVPSTIAP